MSTEHIIRLLLTEALKQVLSVVFFFLLYFYTYIKKEILKKILVKKESKMPHIWFNLKLMLLK